MTGQPETLEELKKANRRANKDETEEKTDDEKLDELRKFRQTARDEGNDKIGAYGEPQTDDDTEMVVSDGDDEQTFTRDEWEAERSARTRVWDRLERDGGMYVRVARWLNNADVNKVKTGQGFYGHKVGETDKALKLEVQPNNENHAATVETVWVPKSAVRTHQLKK